LFLWVYEVYYYHSGDVFTYMDEYGLFGNGTLSSGLLRQPRVKWFIWATYPLFILGGKSILGTALVFVSFSVLSKWVFFQTYKNTFGLNEWVLFASVFLMPSFMFWTSGITKESVVVSVVLLSFTLLKKNDWISRFIVGLLFLSILQIKPYILVMLLLFFGVYRMLDLKRNKKVLLSVGLIFVLCAIWYFFPKFSPIHVADTLNQNASSSLSLDGGSDLDLSVWGDSFFMKGLIGFFAVLFKPFIFGGTLMSNIQGLEKVVLIGLVLLFLLWKQWNLPKGVNLLLLGWFVSLSIILTLSSPNLGTISRYSVYYAPLLLYFLLANLSFSETGFQSIKSNKATDHGETHQPTPKKK